MERCGQDGDDFLCALGADQGEAPAGALRSRVLLQSGLSRDDPARGRSRNLAHFFRRPGKKHEGSCRSSGQLEPARRGHRETRTIRDDHGDARTAQSRVDGPQPLASLAAGLAIGAPIGLTTRASIRRDEEGSGEQVVPDDRFTSRRTSR